MLTITDQLNLANILTLEPRESNVIYIGSNIKVETIPEYLARVDIFNRYLGLEVLVLEPAGEYTTNDFLNHISLENIYYRKYSFSRTLNDLELLDSGQVINVIDSLVSTSVINALSANQGRILKDLIDSISVETDPVFTNWITNYSPAYIDDIPTTLAELSEDSTHRLVTDANIADFHSHSNKTALDLVSGTNTGDNAVNSLYSGLTSFPGFGTDHLTSAYGDHIHTGVYQPAGTYSTDIHSNIIALDNVTGVNTGDQTLNIGGSTSPTVGLSGSNIVTFVGAGSVSLGQTGGTITVTGGSAMTWPAAAGIAVYNGSSAWGTSITDNSANWNTAFGWGNHTGLYAPTSGSANYIQNQLASAQLANSWIIGDNLAGKFTSISTSSNDVSYIGYRHKDSLGRDVVNFDTNGRLNLANYTSDGAVVAIYNNSSAVNGMQVGHYAFCSKNDNDKQMTIGAFQGFVTNISELSTSSKLLLSYMSNLNTSTPVAQPNKSVEISDAGMILPSIPLQATTVKLTNLTNGFLPYHISDASGLANSRIYTDGTKFGILTTAPLAALQVGEKFEGNGDIVMFSNSGATHAGASLSWNMNTTSGFANTIISKIQPDVYNASRGYINYLDFYVGGWNNDASVGSAKISIGDNGKVGINNTAPVSPLDIKGSVSYDTPTLSAEFLTGTGWASTGWTGSWAAGWVHTAGNTSALSYPTAAVSATKYMVEFAVTGRTVGSFTIAFGGQTLSNQTASDTWGPTSSSTAILTITPTTDFDGTIVISIKSIAAVREALVSYVASDGTVIRELRIDKINPTNQFDGYGSGRYNTFGINNTGYGYLALSQVTSGSNNTGIGREALRDVTTGDYNMALGNLSGTQITTGSRNIGVGTGSIYSITTGSYNIGIGYNAVRNSVSALGNVGIGYYSLTDVTGNYNTGIGYYALGTLGNAAYNVGIGYQAGRFITDGATSNSTGTTSVFLGGDTKPLANGESNQIVIGYSAIGNGTNTATIGNTSILRTYLTGVNLKAGTATAGTAALKFTSGTNLTAAEAGAVEWDGTNLFITQTTGPLRKTIAYTTDITAQVYPSAGIALSTGSAWGTSITDNSANWNTAYSWGNHATPGYLTSLTGAVLTDQSVGQTIGATGTRLTKLWATDITVTNAITGSITGNAGTVTNGVYTTGAGTVYLAPNGSAAALTSFPTLNQSTTGSAATLTTPRAIYGNNFDGSAALTQVIASTYGGTGNGFAKFSGPATSEKTFTLPNFSATLLYSGGALGTPSSGVLTNATGLPAASVLAGTFGTGAYVMDTTLTVPNLILSQVASPASIPTVTLNATAGNLNGTYQYVVTYVTATGETDGTIGALPTGVVTSNQQINLTNIPISPDADVIARKIYRNTAANFSSPSILLNLVTTINDNTTTTYTDNIADGSLGVSLPRVNTTGGNIYLGSNIIATTNNVTTSFGFGSLLYNTGYANTSFGSSCLTSNTTGSRNSAFGVYSLSSNTTGIQNTGFGVHTLDDNTTGSYNTSVGFGALLKNIGADYNTAVGHNALYNNTTGYQGSAFGRNALYTNTTGYQNTAVGANALYTNSTGNNNVAVGFHALFYNTLSGNTALGYYAGRLIAGGASLTAPSNSTFVGYDTRASADSQSNEIAIGYQAIANGSNTATIGNSSLLRTYLTGVNLKSGTATAGTAPLKFTSGALLTIAEAGAVEFLTDAYYGTITTGAARKTFAFLEAPVFTTSIQTPIIELGHATDTTISRVSAGVVAVEGVTVPTISSTSTLTNKRINPRLVTAASYTTDTGTSLDVSTCDQFEITAQAGALLFNSPSGTPVGGQKLIIRIKDNGTARALTYNAIFRAIGNALPSTTVLSKILYMGFIYNATDIRWDLVAVAQEA